MFKKKNKYSAIKGYRTANFNLKWKLTNALLEEIEPNAKLTLVL